MKLGLVQAPSVKDVLENIKTIENYVIKAKKEGCQAVCFPECFLTGYVPEEAADLAISKHGEVFDALSLLAVKEGIDILAGFVENDKGQCYVAHGVFKANGECESVRKTHLGEKESLYFSSGDSLDVIELSCGARVGFQICVETHFPEITQTLSLAGAQIIFAPHAVPRRAGDRKGIWMKYIPARSYDNRVFMACCNLWDEKTYGGGCLVTDPNGDVIAENFMDAEGLLTVEINLREVENYHTETKGKRFRYYPSKRKKELYC